MERDPEGELARLAVEKRLLSQEQLAKCLAELQAERARGSRITLSELLVMREVLSPSSAQDLMRAVGIADMVDTQIADALPATLDLDEGAASLLETLARSEGVGAASAQRGLRLSGPVVRQVRARHGIQSGIEPLATGREGEEPASTAAFGGKYGVAGEVARGGMGVILAGEDLDIGREVAIKVMIDAHATTPARVARFVEEAQTQGRLEHPNICPVHELGIDASGRLYFTMKKVKGRSLAEILDQVRANPSSELAGSYSLNHLLQIFGKACDAVAFAHSKGVIHRDLKPANVMVGEFGEVLVMDWGVAKIVGRKDQHEKVLAVSDREEGGQLLSMAGTVIGTPSYMPPEQARGDIGDIDERSDVYALGGILYSFLTLRPPVAGTSAHEILGRVARNEIVPPSRRAPERAIPPDLEAAAMKALAERKQDRYPSVQAFKADVTAFLEGRTLAAAEYSLWQVGAKWVQRNRAFALTSSAATAILLAWGVFYAVDTTRSKNAAERAAAVAVRQTRMAESALKDSQVRLAESLVAQCNALRIANHLFPAKAKCQEAYEIFGRLGIDPLLADLALFELHRRSPPPLHSLAGHAAAVNAVCFSPDGLLVLSAGADHTLRLWDTRTGLEVRTFSGHGDAVSSVAFSADGQRALSGSWDNTLKLWDVKTGREIRTLTGHDHGVASVAFSPDGHRAISGAYDRTLRIWDLETGRALRTMSQGAPVISVALSPDGRHALSAGEDKSMRYWDVATGGSLRVFSGHTDLVLTVAFSPDGRRALSGGYDRTLKLWDLATGREIMTLSGHDDAVRSAVFAPDGRHILSGSDDRTLKLWEASTGREVETFSDHTDAVRHVALSPDGQYALSGSEDRTLKLWRVNAPPEIRTFRGHQQGVVALAVSPDGRLALSGSWDGTLRLWDVETGHELRALVGHDRGAVTVGFSPDGRSMLSGGYDRTVKLWDVATGREIRAFGGHTDAVRGVAFSPDGRYALSGGDDRTLRLWEIQTGKEVVTLAGHTSAVISVAFSPDGTRALSGSADRTLKLWDLKTGHVAATLSGHQNEVRKVAFSPDGNRAVSGSWDRTLKLWDLRKGTLVRTLSGHDGSVFSVAFSPDGRRVVSGSADRTLRLWDLETGVDVQTLSAHSEAVLCVAFSPEGRRILSASEDRTLILWDLSRPARYREFGLLLDKVKETLPRQPEDPFSLGVLGRWNAFRGVVDRAVEFLIRARSDGATGSSLELARLYWQSGRLDAARQELEHALKAKEAPELYLDLCLQAIGRQDGGTSLSKRATAGS